MALPRKSPCPILADVFHSLYCARPQMHQILRPLLFLISPPTHASERSADIQFRKIPVDDSCYFPPKADQPLAEVIRSRRDFLRAALFLLMMWVLAALSIVRKAVESILTASA